MALHDDPVYGDLPPNPGDYTPEEVPPEEITDSNNQRWSYDANTHLLSPLDGQTVIGNGAFGNNGQLMIVNIDPSITQIGVYAFSGCPNLTSVTIPDGCTNINLGAFSQCPNLEYVTIPDSVTTTSYQIFTECPKLITAGPSSEPNNDYNIKMGWTSKIPDQALQETTALVSVKIPDGVTVIGQNAFFKCENLESVKLPDTVTTVKNSSFFNCKKLSKINLPAECTLFSPYWGEYTNIRSAGPIDSGCDLEFGWTSKIPTQAFHFMNSLEKITIPATITGVGSAAFTGCEKLVSAGPIGSNKNIEFGWTTEMPASFFKDITSLTSVELPETLTKMGESGFQNCSALSQVKIPKSVTTMGTNIFSGCKKLTKVSNEEGEGIITVQWDSTIPMNAFYGASIVTLKVPKGITKIDNYAFQNCASLTEVTLPSTLTTINVNAFQGCTVLRSMNFPASLTKFSVGESGILKDCPQLTSVGPKGSGCSIEYEYEEAIPNYAFRSMNYITSVTFSDTITEIGLNAFGNCVALPNVRIPKRIVNFSGSVFNGCTLLTSIGPVGSDAKVIYEWDEEIPAYGFSGIPATSITIVNTITKIGAYAFSNTSATTLELPSGITEIPEGMCRNMNLRTITIPEGVEEIGQEAFYGCSNLTKVILPTTLKRCGTTPFWYCTGLKTVGGPDSGCNVEIKGDSIPDRLFYAANGITTVTIPRNVRTIGELAFSLNEYSLTTLTFEDYVESIGNDAFNTARGLTELNLPNGLKSIGKNAFYLCTGLKKIRMPASVTTIGKNAFWRCIEIKTAGPAGGDYNFEYSWTHLPTNAFSGLDYLEKVTIADTVTEVDSGAFNDCPTLTTAGGIGSNSKIEFAWTKIPTNAFHSNTVLEKVVIPDTVTQMGSDVFYGCTNLTSCGPIGSGKTIEYPWTDKIMDYAFCGASALKDVTIGRGINTIGSNAFSYCKALEQIFIPGYVTTIEAEAFQRSTKLKGIQFYNFNSEVPIMLNSSTKIISIPDPVPTSRVHVSINFGDLYDDLYDLDDTQFTVRLMRYSNDTYEEIDYDLQLLNKSNNYQYTWDMLDPKYHWRILLGSMYDFLRYNITVNDIGDEWVINLSPSSPDDGPDIPPDPEAPPDTSNNPNDPPDTPDDPDGNGVDTIGNRAFLGCTAIEEIGLPDSLTSIGENCFSQCTSLKKVHWSNNLHSLPQMAFYVNGFTDLEIPNTITEIGKYCFGRGDNLVHVTIPKTVQIMSGGVFQDCPHLTTVGPLGSGCAIEYDWEGSIIQEAFTECNNIKTVYSGPKITRIERGAFYQCIALEELIVQGPLTYTGNVSFRDDTKLKHVNIPITMEEIAYKTFFNCPELVIDYEGSEYRWNNTMYWDPTYTTDGTKNLFYDTTCVINFAQSSGPEELRVEYEKLNLMIATYNHRRYGTPIRELGSRKYSVTIQDVDHGSIVFNDLDKIDGVVGITNITYTQEGDKVIGTNEVSIEYNGNSYNRKLPYPVYGGSYNWETNELTVTHEFSSSRPSSDPNEILFSDLFENFNDLGIGLDEKQNFSFDSPAMMVGIDVNGLMTVYEIITRLNSSFIGQFYTVSYDETSGRIIVIDDDGEKHDLEISLNDQILKYRKLRYVTGEDDQQVFELLEPYTIRLSDIGSYDFGVNDVVRIKINVEEEYTIKTVKVVYDDGVTIPALEGEDHQYSFKMYPANGTIVATIEEPFNWDDPRLVKASTDTLINDLNIVDDFTNGIYDNIISTFGLNILTTPGVQNKLRIIESSLNTASDISIDPTDSSIHIILKHDGDIPSGSPWDMVILQIANPNTMEYMDMTIVFQYLGGEYDPFDHPEAYRRDPITTSLSKSIVADTPIDFKININSAGDIDKGKGIYLFTDPTGSSTNEISSLNRGYHDSYKNLDLELDISTGMLYVRNENGLPSGTGSIKITLDAYNTVTRKIIPIEIIVKITEPTVQTFILNSSPSTFEYDAWDAFNIPNITGHVTYNNNTEKDINLSEMTCNPPIGTILTPDDKNRSITVTYDKKTATVGTIKIKEYKINDTPDAMADKSTVVLDEKVTITVEVPYPNKLNQDEFVIRRTQSTPEDPMNPEVIYPIPVSVDEFGNGTYAFYAPRYDVNIPSVPSIARSVLTIYTYYGNENTAYKEYKVYIPIGERYTIDPGLYNDTGRALDGYVYDRLMTGSSPLTGTAGPDRSISLHYTTISGSGYSIAGNLSTSVDYEEYEELTDIWFTKCYERSEKIIDLKSYISKVNMGRTFNLSGEVYWILEYSDYYGKPERAEITISSSGILTVSHKGSEEDHSYSGGMYEHFSVSVMDAKNKTFVDLGSFTVAYYDNCHHKDAYPAGKVEKMISFQSCVVGQEETITFFKNDPHFTDEEFGLCNGPINFEVIQDNWSGIKNVEVSKNTILVGPNNTPIPESITIKARAVPSGTPYDKIRCHFTNPSTGEYVIWNICVKYTGGDLDPELHPDNYETIHTVECYSDFSSVVNSITDHSLAFEAFLSEYLVDLSEYRCNLFIEECAILNKELHGAYDIFDDLKLSPTDITLYFTRDYEKRPYDGPRDPTEVKFAIFDMKNRKKIVVYLSVIWRGTLKQEDLDFEVDEWGYINFNTKVWDGNIYDYYVGTTPPTENSEWMEGNFGRLTEPKTLYYIGVRLDPDMGYDKSQYVYTTYYNENAPAEWEY